MKGFWYLATPYSKHPRGRDIAHAEACDAAAMCFRAGVLVFCPIAHTHVIATRGDLPGVFDQWAEFDEVMIQASVGMIIVMLDGWDESAGIAAELILCKKLDKPVLYMPPSGPVPESTS